MAALRFAFASACSSPPRVDYVADTTLDVPVESLVLLDSGGRHTAQIRPDMFGLLPEPQPRTIDNADPVIQLALDFVKPLVKQCAS